MIVESTEYGSGSPVENVQILGSDDNFWLAQHGKTEAEGEGFTIRLDYCKRMIVGIQIKNKGKLHSLNRATRQFRVSGSVNETGPWKTLVEAYMGDTRKVNASLVNFTFVEPVEIKYIKFELVSYWGDYGGGLQYFAAIPATSKCLPLTSLI